MARLKKIINSLFPVRATGYAMPPHVVNNIVRLKSSGNYNLQRGRYITSVDIERLREKVMNYKYTK
ncbi:MAG: hypothetical protein Q4D38_00315 [Planctomycetia bacterium]|nr:hypothetical protein [Planctomycetia bacterium]